MRAGKDFREYLDQIYHFVNVTNKPRNRRDFSKVITQSFSELKQQLKPSNQLPGALSIASYVLLLL